MFLVLGDLTRIDLGGVDLEGGFLSEVGPLGDLAGVSDILTAWAVVVGFPAAFLTGVVTTSTNAFDVEAETSSTGFSAPVGTGPPNSIDG